MVLYDASAFAVNGALRKLPFDPSADSSRSRWSPRRPRSWWWPPTCPTRPWPSSSPPPGRRPAKLTYASAGAGTGSHLAAEMFNEQGKIELLRAIQGRRAGADRCDGRPGGVLLRQYRLYAPVRDRRQAARAGGDLEDAPEGAARYADAGRSGMPNYEVLEWNGVFVPKGTPPDRVQTIASAVQKGGGGPGGARQAPAGRARSGGQHAAGVQGLPDTESTRWQALVKARGIRVE